MNVTADAALGEALLQRPRNPRDNRKAATDWVREHFTWEKTLQPLASVIAA